MAVLRMLKIKAKIMMYACEMQICCYNKVKYDVGIKIHFYQLYIGCLKFMLTTWLLYT
jgi:hypothetical protein